MNGATAQTSPSISPVYAYTNTQQEIKRATQEATQDIGDAWSVYKKNGEFFGQVCLKWKQEFASKGGYGSEGKGLSGILTVLNIPRHTADYWIAKVELPHPCEKCGEGFPSKTQLKKHLHRAHT